MNSLRHFFYNCRLIISQTPDLYIPASSCHQSYEAKSENGKPWTELVLDYPEHYFKYEVTYNYGSQPLHKIVGLFIYKGLIGCKPPKVFYAASSKKMGNKSSSPDAYEETGEAADKLIRQIPEDVF